MTTKIKHLAIGFLLASTLWACTGKQITVFKIDNTVNTASSHFSFGELNQILNQEKNKTLNFPTYTIKVITDAEHLAEQAFRIEVNDSLINISGGDERGVMYGILECAEQIKLKGIKGISSTSQTPFIKKRGLKFNIPLDARLPSYDDTGDAAQKNIAEMWNKDYWHEFLDQMARNRYNVLTLWTKHPFPSLIKLQDYPDVAMNDVYVYNKTITPETEKDWNGIDIQDTANLRLVKKISIDEKIAFWQHVMQYAHDRGIDIYFFTWNAFITGAEKYGISTGNETGVSYIRECVKEFVKTYPLVRGIGVTAGERMSWRIAGRSKAQWLYDTYGLGVQDALADNPDRKVDFVFRSHGTTLADIEKDFSAKYPFPVETDYKYSGARMYSSTKPSAFGSKFYGQTKQYKVKSWMNVRNDDIFVYRWGNPNYARDYMKNMGAYDIAGFYIGSDGYVWGREFISKNSSLSGELEIKKHWYREMMWGRLAYNPELDKQFFIDALQNRFPDSDAQSLFETWNTASNIIPTLQSFHYKPGDSQWHVEGCVSMYGFQTILDFIDCPVINKKEIMTIPEYANATLNELSDDRITPVQIADSLLNLSKKSLEAVKTLKYPSDNISEFKETLADIEAMAHLGNYYAWKIKGALAFYLYEADSDASKKDGYKQAAIERLENAQKSWQLFAENSGSRYKTQLLARTVYLDWDAIGKEVPKDMNIVLASKGEKVKRVKLFVHNKNVMDAKVYDPVKQHIANEGCVEQTYPFSHIDSYAEYYARVVVFSEADNDKQVKRMKVEGAVIPSDYKKKGYAVVKHKDIYWVMGKDRKNMEKAIVEFVETVKL